MKLVKIKENYINLGLIRIEIWEDRDSSNLENVL
jgi:hypothetical protein